MSRVQSPQLRSMQRSGMLSLMTAEQAAKRFEWPMLAAALLSIPAVIIEANPAPEPALANAALVIDWIVWTAFAIEATTMLILVPNRWAWIRKHPLEIAIVLLTPPLLTTGPLQALRIFRLFRLLAIARAIGLTRRLFSLEGVRDAAVTTVAVVLAGGAAFSQIEREQHLSAWDGVWWAVTTVTTVGYGDIYPRTTGGRIVAMIVMTVGIGFVALLTAAAAQRFARLVEREVKLEEDIIRRLEALEEAENDRRPAQRRAV